jgi:hypothetical protein
MRNLVIGGLVLLLGVAIPATLPTTRGWLIILWAVVVLIGGAVLVTSQPALRYAGRALSPYIIHRNCAEAASTQASPAIPSRISEQHAAAIDVANVVVDAIRLQITSGNELLTTITRGRAWGAWGEDQYTDWLNETRQVCAPRAELVVGLGAAKELTDFPPPTDREIIAHRLATDIAILQSAVGELLTEISIFRGD